MTIQRITTVRGIIEAETDEGRFVLGPKSTLLNEGACFALESPTPLPTIEVSVALSYKVSNVRETIEVEDAITAQSHPQLIALARRYFASLPLDINLTEEQARAELEAGVPGFFRGVG